MTTANTPLRSPGRYWTVRLVPHPGGTASVTCSTAACRMPPRSRDSTKLRAFAAAHAAAHAKAATVNPYAYCRCGSQKCAAHPDTRISCAGAVVLILRHDPVLRRVWTLEEVCERCAPHIPHATVVDRAPAPRPTRPTAPADQTPAATRPAVPAVFSAPPATPAATDPTPRRRSSKRSGRRRSRQHR